MTLIGNLFPEITAPKNMVRYMTKKLCFRGALDREHEKLVEITFQSE